MVSNQGHHYLSKLKIKTLKNIEKLGISYLDYDFTERPDSSDYDYDEPIWIKCFDRPVGCQDGGCEIAGKEEFKGRMGLGSCMFNCFWDPSCFGIDHGKGSREGQCYHNYAARPLQTIKHQDFDSWEKLDKPECNPGRPGMRN